MRCGERGSGGGPFKGRFAKWFITRMLGKRITDKTIMRKSMRRGESIFLVGEREGWGRKVCEGIIGKDLETMREEEGERKRE